MSINRHYLFVKYYGILYILNNNETDVVISHHIVEIENPCVIERNITDFSGECIDIKYSRISVFIC